MGYRVEWLPETDGELREFSKKFKRTIFNKINNVAKNWPTSRLLRTVRLVIGQEELGYSGNVFELDIGSGPRLAFVAFDDSQTLVVYLVGKHDYCMANYLKALELRV